MKKRLIAACVTGMVLMLLAGCKEKKEIGISLLTMHKEIQEEGIFTDNNVVDLGYHIVAYMETDLSWMNSEFGEDSHFTGDRYIAVYAIDEARSQYYQGGAIQYFPDIYHNIAAIRMEEENILYIQYADADTGNMEEVRILVNFPFRMQKGFLDMDPISRYLERKVLSDQEELRSGEAGVIHTAWTESFLYEDEMYEIAFERVSTVYNYFVEHGGFCADYRLTVKNGNGDVICEQMVINYPVMYEEVYWLLDFSGDGFMDIALCTYSYHGRASIDDLHTLIWNPEAGLYEEKRFPGIEEWYTVYRSFPLWNEELGALIFFTDTLDGTADQSISMEMYSFFDGYWHRVRRLQTPYVEDEFGFPIITEYREIVYSEDGEVLEVKILEKDPETGTVWVDVESVWSRYNTENFKLYPESPYWDEVSSNIGGYTKYKYVRRTQDE